ncbi:MAG TPA: glycoside hydrolase family 16 protein [Polyangiaceae bacterium]|nr:glycoside hydrolase family 16 protein [Polyangiaceae bacterium]
MTKQVSPLRRCSWPVLSLTAASLLTGCALEPQEFSDELGETEQAAIVAGITFRTEAGGRYVGAQNNGGGAVVATATTAAAWETFALDDLNGGSLVSGDRVRIRAGNGQWFQALNGGGSSLNAASASALDWETFTLEKPGGGTIQSNDIVGLRTFGGQYISAQNGGGGTVFAYGASLGAWERFRIGGVPAATPTPVTINNVVLRTQGSGSFLGAQNNGGGAVTATATAAQAWETFSLVDVNGGGLVSGDVVNVRAGGGQFLRAVNGGGAAVDFTATTAQGWESFKLVKLSGSGTIVTGDTVGLQASGGRWVSAQNGGGSTVNANGAALAGWESFVIGVGSTPGDGWRLVWSDEFNGPSIDESKWAYEVQRPGWVNNELQNYTSRRAENARIENGQLVIEARRDWYQGYEYSSARLKTQGKVSWTYGKVEARLQVPTGWGTWPAFWMMPDDFSRGWPACGEIDIMEHVGYDANVIHATTHSQKYNWKGTQQRTSATPVPGATSGFKTYTAEWFPDRIDFSVDGRKYFTSPNDNTGDDAWPFNKRFYIILNLAVGGDWGGAKGVDPNVWPEQMRVDWVRVYQR